MDNVVFDIQIYYLYEIKNKLICYYWYYGYPQNNLCYSKYIVGTYIYIYIQAYI